MGFYARSIKTNLFHRVEALNTYHLLTQCSSYQRGKENPDLIDDNKFIARQYGNPFRFVGVGIYDDAGSIEGYDNCSDVSFEVEGSWWDYQFLVHKNVAEALLERSLNLENLEADAIGLIEIAFEARVQLAGTHLLGHGHFNQKEIDLQRKIATLSNQILDKCQGQLDQGSRI